MIGSWRQWAALAFLVLVLVLGGASAAGFNGNMILQFVGASLIAWTLWSADPGQTTSTGLRGFLAGLAVLAAVQFLPLPPAIWQALPGRDGIARGFELAGIGQPWLTLSLDPWGTLQSLVWWIPAIAIFIAFRSATPIPTRRIVWAIAAVAYPSAILAIAQSSVEAGYFYDITNFGNGVGFFSNSNHFGSFMLMTTALVAGQWIFDRPLGAARTRPRLHPLFKLLAIVSPLVLGVFLSGSLACMLLLIPLIVGIAMIYASERAIHWPIVGLVMVGFLTLLVWLLSSGIASNDLLAKSATQGISRGEFLTNGLQMLKMFAPFGSGIGTFREIYPWYENAAQVGTTYVNHAHNDLLELLIETGVFGLVLLGLFLNWFIRKAWVLWNGSRAQNPLALAATLAIVLVLIHSVVDYPLRTAAISGLLALCSVIACRPADQRGALARPDSGAGKREVLMQI